MRELRLATDDAAQTEEATFMFSFLSCGGGIVISAQNQLRTAGVTRGGAGGQAQSFVSGLAATVPVMG